MTSINKRYLAIGIVILAMILTFCMHTAFNIFSNNAENTFQNIDNSTIRGNVVEKNSLSRSIEEKITIDNQRKLDANNDKKGEGVEKNTSEVFIAQNHLDPDSFAEHLPLPEPDIPNIHNVPRELLLRDYNLSSLDPNRSSLGSKILELFTAHNIVQDKISKIAFDGESLWVGYSERLWPLHFEYNRADGVGLVESGDQRCLIRGEILLNHNKGYGSMQTNALHLLIFRKYDPDKFRFVEDSDFLKQGADGKPVSVPVKVVQSDQEILRFETATGHLLQAEIQVGKDVVTIDMDDFVLVDKSQEIVLPMLIRIKVPDKFFTVGLRGDFDRVIQLAIDPKQIQLE